MIISHAHRYVFVHIPKTGGTSLSLALEAKVGKDDILIGDTPKAVKRRNRVKALRAKGRLWKHAGLADIDGVLNPNELANFTIFTIARNPWDRFVSYYHWLREQSFQHALVTLAKVTRFDDFLQNPAVVATLQSDQTQDYLTDASGVLRSDLVLRLEHMSKDIARLEELLDLKLGDIPHTNVSQRPRDYRVFYTAEGRDIIGRAYRDDISEFGYEF